MATAEPVRAGDSDSPADCVNGHWAAVRTKTEISGRGFERIEPRGSSRPQCLDRGFRRRALNSFDAKLQTFREQFGLTHLSRQFKRPGDSCLRVCLIAAFFRLLSALPGCAV